MVENRGKISHFLTPCEKWGSAGGEVCRDYSCHTSVLSVVVPFTRRQSAVSSHYVQLTKNDLEVKHITSGNFVAGG